MNLSLFLVVQSPINHKIKPTKASVLKLHFFHNIYSKSFLFNVSFTCVFIMVCILCMFCVKVDNNFEPTVYEERSLFFLYFYGPI